MDDIKNGQEKDMEVESEGKLERIKKAKESVDKLFGYIFSSILVLGLVVLIYFQHKSLNDTAKTLLIFCVLVGGIIGVYKYLKLDAFKEVVLFSLFIILFKIANNYFVTHESHFDIGSVYALGFSFGILLKWIIKGKRLPLRGVIGLIIFFAVYIAIDLKISG
jgi:hypothetical protein